MFWPFRRREPTYPEIVALVREIPLEDLAAECESFADSAIRSKPGGMNRRLHWAKFRAGMTRLKDATRDLR